MAQISGLKKWTLATPRNGNTGRITWFALMILIACISSFAQRVDAQVSGAENGLGQPNTLKHLALEQILASSRSKDPFLRANAVEALQSLPNRVVPLIGLALDDEHPAVRYVALVTIGMLHLHDIAPVARMLLKDSSGSVRAGAMFALRQCELPVDISPLAPMLAEQNPSLRGNVAMLLGQMGDRSAVVMLKDLAGTPMPRAAAVQGAIVRVQIAEALVRLGDDSALNALRAGAYSQFDEVRVLAVSIMGRLNDRRMESAFEQMLKGPPIELQITAASALARLGKRQGVQIVQKACDSSIPTVRAQAALALALFPGDTANQKLADLLQDPIEQVRLSAAAAVYRWGMLDR